MKKTSKIIGRSVLVFFTIIIFSLTAVYGISMHNAKKNTDENKSAADFIDTILTFTYSGQIEQLSNVQMPVINFNGTDYSAMLDIPSHSVHIPIRSEWQKQFFDASPCCFSGSCYDGSLIIGGSDFSGQFDFLSDIDIGDNVKITDMTGAVFIYNVDSVKHSKNINKDLNNISGYDFSFFGKSKKSHDYILVLCNHQD